MPFKLRRKMCSTCIYGPTPAVTRARREHYYKPRWLAGDTHHICHQEQLHGQVGDVCCRGFYDANPGIGQLRRIAERLGAIEEVD